MEWIQLRQRNNLLILNKRSSDAISAFISSATKEREVMIVRMW